MALSLFQNFAERVETSIVCQPDKYKMNSYKIAQEHICVVPAIYEGVSHEVSLTMIILQLIDMQGNLVYMAPLSWINPNCS